MHQENINTLPRHIRWYSTGTTKLEAVAIRHFIVYNTCPLFQFEITQHTHWYSTWSSCCIITRVTRTSTQVSFGRGWYSDFIAEANW